MTDATEEDGDNLWNRLRRRKVVQWGIVYVADGFGPDKIVELLAGEGDEVVGHGGGPWARTAGNA